MGRLQLLMNGSLVDVCRGCRRPVTDGHSNTCPMVVGVDLRRESFCDPLDELSSMTASAPASGDFPRTLCASVKEISKMPIVATEGASMPTLAQDQYPAVCVHVIDIGTQQPHPSSQFPKKKHQVTLVFELPGQRVEFTKENGEEVSYNRTVSRTFTLSLHEKGKLRPFLVGWRGRKFTSEELQRFELDQLVGVPCMVQIVHSERNGKTYADAENVYKLPKGMQPPVAERGKFAFSLSDFEGDIVWPHDMPNWIREKIENSEEYLFRFRNEVPGNDAPPPHDDNDGSGDWDMAPF